MNRLLRIGFIAILSFGSTACKDSADGATSLAKVSGTVTLDNKPMGGGEIRFSVPGQPTKSIPIKDGAFSGEVNVGKNQVEVVWEQDGPPNPMDQSQRIKVNTVSPRFSGPDSVLSADIGKGGATDLKFEVTSAKR